MRTAIAALLSLISATAAAAPPADYRQRLAQDEVIYFLLPDRFDNADPANDRGGLSGDRLRTGFDPTSKAFYNGGDLKGIIRRLDYIQSLGATAIWVAPIFKNRPVQHAPENPSAGYHGYWITDFTTVDPHFGTDADFKALVDAAHKRGLKVYMDIVVNHTADVIGYAECPTSACPYRSKADYPYSRKGGPGGPAINPGFAGDELQTDANFAKLTDPNYAYTVRIAPEDRAIKSPAWLNNPIYYHNRGDSTFKGENSLYGDFVGLDDVMTEHPRVIRGMIEIYESWIDRFGIDGYRIDTEQHVNPAFWRAFNPAILAHARARGIPNFHIFGEVSQDVSEPGYLALRTREDKLPATLDFSLWATLIETVGKGHSPTLLANLFKQDGLYAGGPDAALQLPTFTGNHDKGRFAWFARQANPNAPDSEILARTRLAHAMLLLLRGVPTIYAGDEQGFVGSGGDQASRQSLFASKVADYNAEALTGTSRTTATDNFGQDHPLFREIATLARLRTATPALTRGRQVTRWADEKPGIFAVSRFDPTTGREVVIAFNMSAQPLEANILVETASTRFTALYGACPSTAQAPGSVHLSIPAFGAAVCAARS